MALDTNDELINGQGGIVVQGSAVSGGYFVTQSTSITTTGETGKIPDYACVEGALCYCTGDSKFHQYDGSSWPVASIGGSDPNLDAVFKTVTAQKFYATSDARLKENFKEYISDKSILELPIYTFDFINGVKNNLGCKAQDLQEICPEIVNENENGYLSIQESKIVYLLLLEVKRLSEELAALKETNNGWR